jgi:hypothetical protein
VKRDTASRFLVVAAILYAVWAAVHILMEWMT